MSTLYISRFPVSSSSGRNGPYLVTLQERGAIQCVRPIPLVNVPAIRHDWKDSLDALGWSETMKPSSETPTLASRPSFKRILVAVDGSESAGRAAKVALELADKFKADLIILHAINPPTTAYRTALPSVGPMVPPPLAQNEIDAYYAYARKVALGIMGETVSEAKKRGINVKPEIPEGVASIVETIINHASNEKADLIIVGTRGLGGFKKMLIGSVSSGVVTHSTCPVMIVR